MKGAFGVSIENGIVMIGDTDMYYVRFGEGSRKLIVLPGLSDGLTTVKGKAWLLSASYKAFFRDYTVYMFSRKNSMPDGYSIRDMAEDQVIAMKRLGIEKACVLGVSQGGMIAQYMAVDHPEVVDRLVLAVTAPNANDTVKDVISKWVDMAKRGEHTELIIDTAEKMYSAKYLEKNRRVFSFIARLTKPADYDRFFKNADAILSFDVRGDLNKIQSPTLIVAGSDDKTIGKSAAFELNMGISDSELFVYEGLGHGAFEEAKDFYDRILKFCDGGAV